MSDMNASCRVLQLCMLVPVFSVSAQSVVGTVTERSSTLRVPRAGIVLLDTNGRARAATLADSVGYYTVTAPTQGVYRVSIQGPGLATINSEPMRLEAGSVIVFDAVLSLGAIALPTVVVKDKAVTSAPLGNPHKYDEFLQRKALGMGRFITRAEIDSKPQSETRSLFSNIPGIKLRIDGVKWFLQSQRCSGRSIPGLDAGALAGQMSGPDPSLRPLLFVDGHLIARDYVYETLRDIAPQQIEGIEVYQGASEMPVSARGDACFAVYIWLRT